MRELLTAFRVLGPKKIFSLAQAWRRFWGDILRGHYATCVIEALFGVRLIDAMHEFGTIDPGRFANEKNLDEEILNRLCEYMYTRKLFDKNSSGYCLTDDGPR